MVFAKTSKAASRLSDDVRERRIEKEYLAVVDRKTRKRKASTRRLSSKKSKQKY